MEDRSLRYITTLRSKRRQMLILIDIATIIFSYFVTIALQKHVGSSMSLNLQRGKTDYHCQPHYH